MRLSLTILADQLKTLLEVVNKNKRITERLEQNWDKDRQDFGEFKNRLGHLEQEVASLKEVLLKLPNQTQNQVADAIAPVIEETQELKDVIVGKEMVAIDVQKTEHIRKSWYQFWK